MATSTAQASANNSSACTLLDLPAEVRNAIFSHAIVSETAIVLSAKISTTALACTNHQIRDEVLKVYYSRNRFVLRIHDYDITTLAPALDLLCNKCVPLEDNGLCMNIVTVVFTGMNVWRNFVQWAHLTHEGKVPVVWNGGALDEEGKVISLPLELLAELGTDFRGIPKAEVEEMLEGVLDTEHLHNHQWV